MRTNWAGSVVFAPRELVAVSDEQQLARRLAAWAEQGRRVRAVGAGHSFSPIAASDDVQVELSGSGLLHLDPETGEATLAGGTRIRDIAPLLAPHGRALASMGDIDAQTIAGAVSTGTHGTGLRHTGYSGQVTGLRLALPDGALVDVDAEHDPELFAAARVGLGCVGLITRVRIRTVPAFALLAHETTEPVADVLASFVERAQHADHLEFFWFPGTSRATVKHNQRLGAGEPTRPMSRLGHAINRELLANTVYGGACAAACRLPALAPAVRTVASRLMAGDTFSDESHRVFVAPRRVRFVESEYAMPLAAFGEVVPAVERAIVASGLQVTFPLEVRVSAADDTWLGTASGRESVYVAVHRYHREDFAPLLAVVEPVFRAHEGRPHWGKRHTLDAARVAELYPHLPDFQRARERVDPRGVLLNDHVARLLAG